MVEIHEEIQTRPPLPRPETREKPAQVDELGQVLLKARDYIREHGWCQNAFMDYTEECSFPAVCLLGSLNWALGHPIDEDEPDRIWECANRLGFLFPARVSVWNDQFDRTQQEVEERLERAAYNL